MKDYIEHSLQSMAIQVKTKAAGKIYNARKSGVKGDGINYGGITIQKDIETCDKNNTVPIPSGNYLVGHIELQTIVICYADFNGYKKGGNYHF